MTRKDFQDISRLRLRESGVLLRAKEWAGAYYLAGYSIECGLKACICKNVKRHSFPDRPLANGFFSHVLEDLVKLAGLNQSLDAEMKRSTTFRANWGVVKDWKETSRYRSEITREEARGIYEAITSRTFGIKTWMCKHW